MEDLQIQRGFPDSTRRAAALLFDAAFATKLRAAIPDAAARVSVLVDGFRPAQSIAGMSGEELVGLAGFNDGGGSFTGGTSFGLLRDKLGFFGAVRAVTVLALLERKLKPGELLMDGIVVRADSRGRGIGTRLFAELESLARDGGKNRIRLDVVDTNPAARRLYERLGFEAVKTERVPFFARSFGFSAATTMLKRLD